MDTPRAVHRARARALCGLWCVVIASSCGSSASDKPAGGDASAAGTDAGGGTGTGPNADAMGAPLPDAMAPTPIDPCVEAGTCPAGVWEKEDLPGFATPDTVETVVADPVKPSDFYAFAGSNNGPTIKVYGSTDFGVHWTNVNTTAALTGNPWGASIDPNPHRDPGTLRPCGPHPGTARRARGSRSTAGSPGYAPPGPTLPSARTTRTATR